MKELKILSRLNRPFLKASLFALFGCIASCTLGAKILFFLLPLILLCFLARRLSLSLLCCIMLLCALNHWIDERRPSFLELFYGRCVKVEGTVKQRQRRWKDSFFFKLRSNSIHYRRTSYNMKADIICVSKERLPLFETDKIKVKAFLYPTKLKGADGVMYLCREDLLSIEDGKNLLFNLAKKLRERFLLALSHLPHPHDKLLASMLLWQRESLPQKIKDAFARSGTAHLLAVSGLHVGLVASFLYLLTIVFLRLKKEVFTLSCLFLLPFYTIMVGAPPSCVRATLMCLCALGATLLDRDIDPFNSLSVALFFILLLDPLAVGQLSLWLSFSATAGIILGFFLFKSGRASYFKGLLFASIFAYLFTFPICSYFFGRIAVFGILANLFAVPLTSFLLNSGLSLSIISLCPLNIEKLLLPVCLFFSKALLLVINTFSSIPGCILSFKLPLPFFPIYYALLLLTLLLWRRILKASSPSS